LAEARDTLFVLGQMWTGQPFVDIRLP
jgi:hypothetical protein